MSMPHHFMIVKFMILKHLRQGGFLSPAVPEIGKGEPAMIIVLKQDAPEVKVHEFCTRAGRHGPADQ